MLSHMVLKKMADIQETSASCENLKYESVTEFTAEANHITSSLRSLIAIQVIGFCWSHPHDRNANSRVHEKAIICFTA